MGAPDSGAHSQRLFSCKRTIRRGKLLETNKLTSELDFELDFRDRNLSWIFELDFRVRISSWISSKDVELFYFFFEIVTSNPAAMNRLVCP